MAAVSRRNILRHRSVDIRAVVLGVDIMIQVKNPFRPCLKIIDFNVGIGEQDSGQGFLLLQMIVKRTDGVN